MQSVTLDLSPSRRSVLAGAGRMAVGLVALGAAAAAMAEPPKSSQNAVQYQDHPKGGHACNTCNQFQGPHGCKSVEGYIAPSGWCDKYTHV